MRNHFKSIRSTWILGVIGFAVAGHATDGPVPVPVAHHPNIAEITLFAENPDIVTPIGIAVAPDGRVVMITSAADPPISVILDWTELLRPLGAPN